MVLTIVTTGVRETQSARLDGADALGLVFVHDSWVHVLPNAHPGAPIHSNPFSPPPQQQQQQQYVHVEVCVPQNLNT